MPRALRPSRIPPWGRLLAIFLLLSAAIVGVGVAGIRAQERVLERRATAVLDAVAALKVRQLATWRDERAAEVRFLVEVPRLRRGVEQALSGPIDETPARELSEVYAGLARNHEYRGLYFVDAAGGVRLRLGTDAPLGDASGELQRAAAAPEGVVSDFAISPSGTDFVDLIQRVRSTAVPGADGWVIARLDAQEKLFPYVRAWPIPSRSAETLVVRRVGSEIEYLDVRPASNAAAPPMRRPLGASDLPATQALAGRRGALEGIDYRGVPVLAFARPIPGTEWILLAKIDRAEAYEEVRSIARLMGLLVSTSILAAASLLGFLWRRREARLDRERFEAQRRADEELRASETRTRLLLDAASEAIFAVGRDARCTFANPAAVAMLGHADVREILGRDLHELMHGRHPDGSAYAATECELRQALQAGEPITRREKTMWRSDGTPFACDFRAYPLRHRGELIGAMVMVTDLTERRRAEEAVKTSESWVRGIFAAGVAGVLTGDAISVHEANDAFLRMIGYGRDDLEAGALHWDRIVPPEEREPNRSRLRRLRESGTIAPFETEFVHRDGGRVPALVGAALVEGHPILMALDIRERKAAERTLRAQTEMLAEIGQAMASFVERGDWGEAARMLLQAAFRKTASSSGFLGILDDERRLHVVFAGPATPTEARDAFRAAQGRMEHDGRLVLPRFDGLLAKVIDGGEPVVLDGGLVDGLPAGHPPLERLLAVPVRAGDRVAGLICLANRASPYALAEAEDLEVVCRAAGILFDSDRRRQRESTLHEQLRQMQRVESLGRLAGGVAHDFNNLLTVILGSCGFLRADLAPSDPRLADVAEIEKAGQRATALTRQLLAFSRKQVLVPEILSVNRIVEGVEKMLRRLIGEDIELKVVLADEIAPIDSDPGQLEQVIMNLVVNARDAMPSGGKLTISTRNVTLDDEYVQRHTGARAGRHVMLAVSDNGAGMDEGVRSHIFEPFFTTKDKSKGTGLGLSTVYGIVKQSGGSIWFYSEPGLGTTFKIYLPAAEGEIRTAAQRVPARPATGSEAILLVEDADGVRRQARRVLAERGYRVIEAANPAAALAAVEGGGRIDLLLTDVVMPGMSGRELAERLSSAHPALRVLYMSGYTDEAIVHHGVLLPGTHFLQKPFSADGLAIKVREVLDGGRRSAA